MTGLKDTTWGKVRRFWGFPRINPPRILSEEEASAEGMNGEIAAIRMTDNQILVNKRNLEERVGAEHLPRVVSHEVGHYQHCPYDLRNLVRLIGHADLVTRNIKHAKLIQNLYADLCVNTNAYRKGDQRMVDLYRRLSQNNDSELWHLYIATYENMIGCQGMIIPQQKEEIRIQAKKLADVVGSAMDHSNKWPDSIKDFAKVVQDYIRKEEKAKKDASAGQCDQGDGQPQDVNQPQNGDQSQGDDSSNPSPSSQGCKPAKNEDKNHPDIMKGMIDYHEAKDFLPCDPKTTSADDMGNQIEKELKGLSKELGQREFKRVVTGLGLGTSMQANTWLYRELVKDYMIFMPQTQDTRSGSFKETPTRWTLDEPLDQLDIEYSLSQSPIIIPNVTTYKWKTSNGESYSSGRGSPDLLIVIDSSASMPNPKSDLSFPVLSAMIAAHSALSYGNKVGVINFSSLYKSCEFTNQTRLIDEAILHYYNGGTQIPGEELVRMTAHHKYPTHTLIISDTAIGNLNLEAGNLEKALKNSKAGGSIFLCCEPSDKTKMIEQIGYVVHFACDFSELGNLTLEKSKELYSG